MLITDIKKTLKKCGFKNIIIQPTVDNENSYIFACTYDNIIVVGKIQNAVTGLYIECIILDYILKKYLTK